MVYCMSFPSMPVTEDPAGDSSTPQTNQLQATAIRAAYRTRRQGSRAEMRSTKYVRISYLTASLRIIRSPIFDVPDLLFGRYSAC